MEKKFNFKGKEYASQEEFIQAMRDDFLEGESHPAYKWRKELPKEIALDPGYDVQRQKYMDNMAARAAKRKALMEANIKKYLHGTRAISGCVFCKIALEGTYTELMPNGIMRIKPLNQIVDNYDAPYNWKVQKYTDNTFRDSDMFDKYGHMMFVPIDHSEDASDDPRLAANAFYAAAEWIDYMGIQANIITSVGVAATQSVFHTHIHVVPRDHQDDLLLPWTFQDQRSETEYGRSFVEYKKFSNVNEAPKQISKFFSSDYKRLLRNGVLTKYEDLH